MFISHTRRGDKIIYFNRGLDIKLLTFHEFHVQQSLELPQCGGVWKHLVDVRTQRRNASLAWTDLKATVNSEYPLFPTIMSREAS